MLMEFLGDDEEESDIITGRLWFALTLFYGRQLMKRLSKFIVSNLVKWRILKRQLLAGFAKRLESQILSKPAFSLVGNAHSIKIHG